MTAINLPLGDLNSDENFIQQSHRLGLFTLADILNSKLETLIKNKAFTYTWYADVLSLLKEHNLLSEFRNRQL